MMLRPQLTCSWVISCLAWGPFCLTGAAVMIAEWKRKTADDAKVDKGVLMLQSNVGCKILFPPWFVFTVDVCWTVTANLLAPWIRSYPDVFSRMRTVCLGLSVCLEVSFPMEKKAPHPASTDKKETFCILFVLLEEHCTSWWLMLLVGCFEAQLSWTLVGAK